MEHELINDGQEFRGAADRFGQSIPTYDDSWGRLWILRDSMGVLGIVRARTLEDAWSIAEDEFFLEATETIEELQAEYGYRREYVKIIRLSGGEERPAKSPDDYADGTLRPDASFVRWDVVETPDTDAWSENDLFREAYGFRPNGPNSRDHVRHGIYARDLNGEYLDALTPALLAELGINLDIIDAQAD